MPGGASQWSRRRCGRCSESANGVKALIANSTQQIQAGVGLVKDAGTTLREIVTAASKVASTVSEISQATTEQANGIDEMARTVAHMDEITQQNSLLAEQSARVARDLQQETEALSTMAGSFRLGGEYSRPVAQLVHAAAPMLRAVPSAGSPLRGRKVASGGGADGWAEF